MELSVTVEGAQQVIHALTTWEDSLGNLRGPLTGLAREVISPMLARRFADQGPGWAPLAPAYAAWKAEHYPGKGILERTGAMRTAFSGGVGWEIEVKADSLMLDPTRTPYWRAHQLGTRRMPARPILAFDARAVATMTSYLSRRLAQLAGEAGLQTSEVP